MKKYLVIITLLVLIVLFKNTFSFKNYSYSALETDRNITRQQYIGAGLGKIYGNRFGIYYFSKLYPYSIKFESIFFSDLGKSYVYIPLFGLFIYFGIKKNYER